MKKRTGDKAGWIGGFSGGFLWLLILGTMWIVKKQYPAGVSTLCLVVFSEIAVFYSAPWKWPETPYWKLMLPI